MAEDMQSTQLVETPVSLLPDLSELGIIEVDRGVCEDTAENRQILRANKMKWQPVYALDGTPTTNILAVSTEMRENRVFNKRALLDNPNNVDSDYITGYQLILNDEAMNWCPGWVLAQTRKWNRVEDEREETGEKKWPHLAGPPGRCSAHRNDGRRCANWHSGQVKDGGLCRIHINMQSQQPNILAAARNRIHSAAVLAVDELENLMTTATSEPVRLKASTEILDRVGIRAGFEIEEKIEVQIKPAAVMVSDRLKKLRAVAEKSTTSAEDIVEAEVVEEEAEHER